MYTDLFDRWCRYRKWRPDERVVANPKAWWGYAGRCIQFDLEATRARAACTWGMVRERNRIWHSYTELLVRKLGEASAWVQPMSKHEEEIMLQHEDGLSVDDLVVQSSR